MSMLPAAASDLTLPPTLLDPLSNVKFDVPKHSYSLKILPEKAHCFSEYLLKCLKTEHFNNEHVSGYEKIFVIMSVVLACRVANQCKHCN